jgi:hypothetical protein
LRVAASGNTLVCSGEAGDIGSEYRVLDGDHRIANQRRPWSRRSNLRTSVTRLSADADCEASRPTPRISGARCYRCS